MQKRHQTLKQGFMYVDDYVKVMEMVIIQANYNEDEEATMPSFLNSLNGLIVNIVELQQYVNLDELVKLAVKVGKQN